MKADRSTQPDEVRFHSGTKVAFVVAWGNWKLDNSGLHRWWAFKAVKPNTKGKHAIRYGWKRILR